MKYRFDRFDLKMSKDQSKLEQFPNNLAGEVDFLLIVEKLGRIEGMSSHLDICKGEKSCPRLPFRPPQGGEILPPPVISTPAGGRNLKLSSG